MNPAEVLDVVASQGRRMPQVVKMPDESVEVFDRPSKACPGCGLVTAEGDEITKVCRVWWHAACARGWLAQVGEDEAWMVIARQVAAHPSRFKSGEVRTVVEQLLRMAAEVAGARCADP